MRSRVQAHLDYWIPRLGLTPWVITVRWTWTALQRRHFRARHQKPIAAVTPFREAMSADLTFNEARMTRDIASDFELEVVVVHELVHVLVNGNEHQTNALATALVRERRQL